MNPMEHHTSGTPLELPKHNTIQRITKRMVLPDGSVVKKIKIVNIPSEELNRGIQDTTGIASTPSSSHASLPNVGTQVDFSRSEPRTQKRSQHPEIDLSCNPPVPLAEIASSYEAMELGKKKNRAGPTILTVEDDDAPIPFEYTDAAFERNKDAKMQAAAYGARTQLRNENVGYDTHTITTQSSTKEQDAGRPSQSTSDPNVGAQVDFLRSEPSTKKGSQHPEIDLSCDPPVPLAEIAASYEATEQGKKKNRKGPTILTVDDDDAPIPFEYTDAAFERNKDSKIPAATIGARNQLCNENVGYDTNTITNQSSTKEQDAGGTSKSTSDPNPSYRAESSHQPQVQQNVHTFNSVPSEYEVSARLVHPALTIQDAVPIAEQPPQQSNSMIFDGIVVEGKNQIPTNHIPQQESPPTPMQHVPWWKRRSSYLIGLVFVALLAVIAALVATQLKSKTTNTSEVQSGDTRTRPYPTQPSIFSSTIASKTTVAPPHTRDPPTRDPPTSLASFPQKLCARFTGTVFDVDCSSDCFHTPAIDGDTFAVATSRDFIKFFSILDDKFEELKTVDINYVVTDFALSGNFAVVGSAYKNNDAGGIYVIGRYSNGEWGETLPLDNDDSIHTNERFGWAVSIHNDVMAVAERNGGEDYRGVVHMFRRRPPATWEIVEKIYPYDSVEKDFGYNVLVDDTLVAIGSDTYVSVFELDQSRYQRHLMSVSRPLHTPIFQYECNHGISYSFGLTNDGGLLVGCIGEKERAGEVHYLEQSPTGDDYVLKQKISASDGAPEDNFGWHLSVEDDTMVVGMLKEGGTSYEEYGKAYVFTRAESEWTEIDKITLPAGYGITTALSQKRILITSGNKNVNSYLIEECS